MVAEGEEGVDEGGRADEDDPGGRDHAEERKNTLQTVVVRISRMQRNGAVRNTVNWCPSKMLQRIKKLRKFASPLAMDVGLDWRLLLIPVGGQMSKHGSTAVRMLRDRPNGIQVNRITGEITKNVLKCTAMVDGTISIAMLNEKQSVRYL